MKIEIIGEYGYQQAMFGLGLSYGKTSCDRFCDFRMTDVLLKFPHQIVDIDDMKNVAMKLCDKDKGHNKFLESIVLWLDITAMRGWWQQFDTYRCGVTKNSESTMHTILKSELTQDNFEKPIHNGTLDRLNELIRTKDFEQLKIELPEGFLQRRIVCLNYKSLRNIINQRKSHRLIGWSQFCDYMIANVEHPEFLR